MKSRSNRFARTGFTLIELMVVVAMVAILLAIAIPSFRSITQRNRIASQINSLIGDLQFARSEAVKRGLPVSICPSSDGLTCLDANTWHSGWIVRDPASTVIRRRMGWASSDTFIVTPTTVRSFTYNRDGFANVTDATIVMHTSPLNSDATRCVWINRVGRQIVQSAGTGSCS